MVAAVAQAVPIVVGMTLPLTGPDAALGLALRDGAQLAAARANAAGGVGGRPLEMVVRDDGGDPRRAADNAGQFLRDDAVAIVGVVGAAATAAVAEVLAQPANGAAVAALVAPVTSAEWLRTPPRPGVFHLRASAAEQASAAMLHLDTLGVERYALMAHDDAFGQSALERLKVELVSMYTRPIAIERLSAGAPATTLQQAIARICAAEPQALILAMDAAPASQALDFARARNCAPQYLVFSETGAVLTAREPDTRGQHPFAGLLVTQVVPHPQTRLHPLVAEYQRESAARSAGNGSHGSLEGYLALRVVHEALRACAREPGRRCLLQALASRTFDLPGMRIRFGSAQLQPRPFVEINMIGADGRLRH